jgi:hypothetical protein
MVLWTRRRSPHAAIGRRQSIIGVPHVWGMLGWDGTVGLDTLPNRARSQAGSLWYFGLGVVQPHVAMGRRQSIIGVSPVGDAGLGGAIGLDALPNGLRHRLEAYGTLDSASFTPRGNGTVSKYHRRPACRGCWVGTGPLVGCVAQWAQTQAGSLWYFGLGVVQLNVAVGRRQSIIGVPPVGDAGLGREGWFGYIAQSGPVTGWKPMVLGLGVVQLHVAMGRRQSKGSDTSSMLFIEKSREKRLALDPVGR